MTQMLATSPAVVPAFAPAPAPAPAVHRGPHTTTGKDVARALGVGYRVLTRLETVQTSRPLEFVDVTERVAQCVADAGIEDGSVLVYSRHTTAAIRINEHEPLLIQDMERLLARLAPEGGYCHDDMSVRTVNLNDDERVNGHSHCRSLLLAASETIPVAGGRLLLGRWQRIFFVELDGPARREMIVQVTGCAM
jgi:secondary thiamine-phosphate synthase enzyme